METVILRGKPTAERVLQNVRAEVAAMERPPKLAAVGAGADPAGDFYVASQMKRARKLGVEYELLRLPEGARQDDLNAAVRAASEDEGTDGVIILTPLPPPLDVKEAREHLAPDKDVEGITPAALGSLALGLDAPAAPTARAAWMLAREHMGELAGVEALVAGYSDTVGKPLSMLLLNDRATVTVARSRVRDLPALVGRAELVFACMGKARYIRGEWLRPGAVVIDVGTNEVKERDEEGNETVRWVGDVDFDSALGRAAAVTPVPGGVGMLTTALLFDNLVRLCRKRKGGQG